MENLAFCFVSNTIEMEYNTKWIQGKVECKIQQKTCYILWWWIYDVQLKTKYSFNLEKYLFSVLYQSMRKRRKNLQCCWWTWSNTYEVAQLTALYIRKNLVYLWFRVILQENYFVNNKLIPSMCIFNKGYFL